ncbi:DUF674 family protein [Medicago truncatula]|uniref:DUF674 family protein n=1 Tax=Medicago truncatula TaxID=3880 RepID=A0A072VR66_MEDTR|nr:DUF674 family protein [Medicago truncatula]
MASSSTKMTLKLPVDTKQNKVLFAEASKAAVDSLLNMFHLSFGTVLRLISSNNVNMHLAGSLGNLHHTSSTLQNLNQNYVLSNFRTPNANDHNLGISLHKCPNGCPYDVTSCDNELLWCCRCLQPMNRKETSGVTMKDQNVIFMLMDDLVIQPILAISVITLINKFNIKQVGASQEIVVEFGMNECVELLNTSLQSEMVLISVFIKNKNKKHFTMLPGLKS